MRNPDRISIILERLENLWNKHPDLRLGDFILHKAGYIIREAVYSALFEDNAKAGQQLN